MPDTGRREAGGIWWAVFGGRWAECGVWLVAGHRQRMLAEIMTSVDMVF